MCGFVLYDTQLIVEKRRMGNDDFIRLVNHDRNWDVFNSILIARTRSVSLPVRFHVDCVLSFFPANKLFILLIKRIIQFESILHFFLWARWLELPIHPSVKLLLVRSMMNTVGTSLGLVFQIWDKTNYSAAIALIQTRSTQHFFNISFVVANMEWSGTTIKLFLWTVDDGWAMNISG